MKFAVQYSPLSGRIYAGTLSRDGLHFTDKTEVTSQVIAAIEEKVQRDHRGAALFTRGTENGQTVTVDIDVFEEDA